LKRRTAVLAAAAVLITGCGGSVAGPSLTGHTAPSARTKPSAQTASAAQAGPSATSACGTGWLAGYDINGGGFAPGGAFFTDTPHGLRAAVRDSYRPGVYNMGPDQGVRVTFKAAHGITVHVFTVELIDRGTVIGQVNINDQPGMPRFLAPGESVSYVIDWGDYPGQIPTMSKSAYLRSSCNISGWS
jgi:hypothetical protein